MTIVLLGAGLALTAPATPGGADGNEAPGAPSVARALTAGVNHTCAILTNSRVKCWGQNSFGALGLDDGLSRGDNADEMGDALPFVDLGPGRTATAISAGSFHTCALLDGGDVKCWGTGGQGQNGNESNANIGDNPGEMAALLPVDLGPGRTAVAISAGDAHTCAILDNGAVKCWGKNANGQLGLGDTTPFRGANPNTMGSFLPPVALGTNRTATAISAGSNHTCALLDDSSIKCWGYAGWGGLGYGNEVQLGDGPGEMGDSLPAVNLGTTAIAVTVGENHTCAILTGGTARCWGYNVNGQLGVGGVAAYQTSPTGSLSLGLGRTASALSGGGSTCVVLDDETVRCWGLGTSGQLGQGNSLDYGNQVGQVPSALTAIDLGGEATTVTAGGFHNCARLSDGAVKCWGFNVSGQLGQGDNVHRGSGANEMGANLPPIDLGTATPPGATCDGQPVTVDLNLAQVPTAGPDVILGTPGPDTINALGGDDRVCAGDGIDTLNGGTGNDRLFGQNGNDVLRGGAGNDRLDGGEQNDDLFGDAGLDTLFGRNGADDLSGGGGNDTALGGAGNDRVFGQDGNDNLKGEAGNDTLDGGNHNDTLAGGPNTDNCHGRAGVDTQTGCEVRAGIP